ncbi:MAG: PilX N-terminal domain-containing pilus assembly protein [Gammaproteobacteria bacterium]|nr:PilX N-terminal domain-containing pilus assembly protein [Gammaproteobacteria bacterium]
MNPSPQRHHRPAPPPAIRQRQGGAALVVSLLLLVTLTLIGLAGMRGTTMEEKMAGNMRDRNVAFQASEGAVRAGEKWIAQQTDPPPTDLAGPPGANVYSEDADLSDLNREDQAWWGTDENTLPAEPLEDADGNDMVAEQPRYVMQYLDFRPDSFDVGLEEPTGKHFYRVTGHGTGISPTARAVVQTTFVKRFN